MLSKRLTQISGLGQLTAHHVIFALTNLFLLPPAYGNLGTMCKGARAWQKLKTHCDLSDGQVPTLQRILCDRHGFTMSVAENGLCKFGGDMKPGTTMHLNIKKNLANPTKFDAIYNDQDVFRYTDINTMGEAQVTQILRGSKSARKSSKIPVYCQKEVYHQCLTEKKNIKYGDHLSDLFWKDMITIDEKRELESLFLRINRKNRTIICQLSAKLS